ELFPLAATATQHISRSKYADSRRSRRTRLQASPFFTICILLFASRDCADNSNLPLGAQNLFLKRISKLKLFERVVNSCVDACSNCAMNDNRSDTRYSSASI